MDPRMNKGEYNFGEKTGVKRANLPGVYYHPQADKFVETSYVVDHLGKPMLRDGNVVYHESEGKIQADAFVQIGYRPATSEEVSRFRKIQQEDAKKIAGLKKDPRALSI